jgi:cell division septation protein DedD
MQETGMMVQPVVSRSQRRLERKQVVLIAVLVVAVAGISFALGVMFGRQDALPGLAADVGKPKLPMVTKVTPPPPPSPKEAPAKPEKLTFYDNLPKGNQAPLGSGINLPPEKAEVKPQTKVKKVAKQGHVPSKQPSKLSAAPLASADGAFVVQVASFRTGGDAEKLATRLKSYQLSTFVESVDLGKKGVWHRVLSGPYADREIADQAAALLREKERLSTLVRQR